MTNVTGEHRLFPIIPCYNDVVDVTAQWLDRRTPTPLRRQAGLYGLRHRLRTRHFYQLRPGGRPASAGHGAGLGDDAGRRTENASREQAGAAGGVRLDGPRAGPQRAADARHSGHAAADRRADRGHVAGLPEVRVVPPGARDLPEIGPGAHPRRPPHLHRRERQDRAGRPSLGIRDLLPYRFWVQEDEHRPARPLGWPFPRARPGILRPAQLPLRAGRGRTTAAEGGVGGRGRASVGEAVRCPAPGPASESKPDGPRVFLAEATNDLYLRREEVRGI